jgi:DNA primase
MAKVSPVSIKYMIHANFTAEGALEKPDVIGAVFGQTEGLLGADLEMRELQKEGKIGRIEVDLTREDKRTYGVIHIPTALDQSETTLIAAAIETIDRVGPCDATIEIEKIEDVRGSKRDYIIERAKKLMQQIEGSTDSREIANEIKGSTKMGDINDFGEDKVACGDLSGNEIILVEGRADVVNLMRNNIKNVVAMNGTKLPKGISELSKNKEITLFVDGDRGGRLIAQNVVDNATVKYIASAPDGKEVEELTGKEILMNLRKKVSVDDFFKKDRLVTKRDYESNKPVSKELRDFEDKDKEKLKKVFLENKGTEKAVILNEDLEVIKAGSARALSVGLKRIDQSPFAITIDGTVTNSVIEACEEAGVKAIAANNFAATSKKIKLLSF